MNFTDLNETVPARPAPALSDRYFFFEKRAPASNDLILCIDNSFMESVNDCPRKGEYAMIHGRSSGESSALVYGDAIHQALRHQYTEIQKGTFGEHTFSECVDILERCFLASPPAPEEWRNLEHATENLFRHNKAWIKTDRLLDILHIEKSFRVPITKVTVNACLPGLATAVPDLQPPYFVGQVYVFFTGVIDLIYRTAGGVVYSMDHKTTSIGGPSFWAAFELSSQFRGYKWAMEQSDIHTDVSVVNALFARKPTKSGKAYEHHRVPYSYKQWHLDEWKRNFMQKVRNILTYIKDENWPTNENHCTNKFGICYFHDLCTVEPETRTELIQDLPVNTWNPVTHHSK